MDIEQSIADICVRARRDAGESSLALNAFAVIPPFVDDEPGDTSSVGRTLVRAAASATGR